MRVVLLLILWAGAVVAGDHGLTARFVPEEVRPGEVFELRVEMQRAEYGRFALQVPPHGSLHRVAVASEPVTLEGGFYRQRESWMLQADRSGEIVIEDGAVVMETGAGEETVALPALRVAVVPWASADQDEKPAGFPVREEVLESGPGTWWWIVPVMGAVCLFAWWWRRSVGGGMVVESVDGVSVEEALDDLAAGDLRSLALEQLLCGRGRDWSPELREVVEQAVYVGRGDADEVAEMLRKEAGA